jgi:hypothetical protein
MKVAIDTSKREGLSLMQAGAVRQQYHTVVFETEAHGADEAIRRALGQPGAVAAR